MHSHADEPNWNARRRQFNLGAEKEFLFSIPRFFHPSLPTTRDRIIRPDGDGRERDMGSSADVRYVRATLDAEAVSFRSFSFQFVSVSVCFPGIPFEKERNPSPLFSPAFYYEWMRRLRMGKLTTELNFWFLLMLALLLITISRCLEENGDPKRLLQHRHGRPSFLPTCLPSYVMLIKCFSIKKFETGKVGAILIGMIHY